MLGRFEWNGQPDKVVPVLVKLRGAGAAAPLVLCGPGGEPSTPAAVAAGLNVTRAGVGDYTINWVGEKPGRYLACVPGHAINAPGAATMRHVEVDADSMAGTSLGLRILTVTPATDAAAAAASDLTANDEITLLVFFRQRNVGT